MKVVINRIGDCTDDDFAMCKENMEALAFVYIGYIDEDGSVVLFLDKEEAKGIRGLVDDNGGGFYVIGQRPSKPARVVRAEWKARHRLPLTRE